MKHMRVYCVAYLADLTVFRLPMATSRDSPDDDGYKRFTEDSHNVSYGSNDASKSIKSTSYLINALNLIISQVGLQYDP
jgi:hypothetical protein